MIAEFVKSLEQAGLTQTGGDLTASRSGQSGLTGREIAEALYLALYVSPTGAPPVAAEEPETAQPTEPPQSKPDSTVTPATHEPDCDPVSAEAPQKGDLFTPHAGKSAEGGVSALPYRAAAAIALPGAAEIARALRPLSRRFPSRTRREIDVERTVQQIADGGPYAPVERPAPERWLDVALVVDEGASMRVWRPTISELQRLLERHGAFRDVSVWGISADDGQVRFYRETGMAAPPTRLANPRELFDPNGRRLIVLVSDCIGQGWRTGAAFRLLAEWGERNPVVLAQVLPQRLWAGTALPPLDVELRASAPGIANKRLQPQQGWLTEPSALHGLPLPVVTFEDWSLAPWAQMVAARGKAATAGLLITDWLSSPTPLLDEGDGEDDIAPDLTEEQRAKHIVSRFRASASPMAYRLACYLAAVELTMPVMRLVQQAMLPQSRQIHLAEVFLGGLLRQPKAEEGRLQRPEEIYYDFHPGVRKVLLDLAPKSETKRVMTEVWRLIEQRSPYADDFKVLLTHPGIAGERQIAPGRRAFATISPEAIAKVEGGRSKAQAITLELEQFQEPPDDLATLDDQSLFSQYRQIQRQLIIQVLRIFELQQQIDALASASGSEWERLNRELVAATRDRIQMGQTAERLAVKINERSLKPPVTLEALMIQTIMTEIEKLGDQRHAVVENVTQILNAQLKDDWKTQGRAVCRLGAIFAALGDLHIALRYYEFAREKGDKPAPEIELEATLGLAASYAALGAPDNAVRWLRNASRLAENLGDQAGLFQIRMALGDVRFEQKMFDQAFDRYTEATAIALKLSDTASEHTVRGKLAETFIAMGRPYDAIHSYMLQLSLARDIGDHQSENYVLSKLAETYITLGEPRRAVEFYGDQVNSARAISHSRNEAEALFNLAKLFEKLGERENAIACAEAALKIFDELEALEIDSLKEFITRLRTTGPPAEEGIRDLAQKYERIRAEMPSGNERTWQMEEVMAEMKALVPSIHFMLPSLTESDFPGLRLAAVAILYEMPDLQYINWLADRIGIEKPFIEYHAADALLSAVRNLDTGFYGAIQNAINKAINVLETGREKTDRLGKLKEAQRTLQQNWTNRFFNPPDKIRSIGRQLAAGDYAGLMSQLGKSEVLIGLFSNQVDALVATHIQCRARMNEVERLFSPVEYYAVSRNAANEGMNIPIPPLPGEQEEKKSEQQPFALSTFEFETVTLDAQGKVKERRKLQARQFLEELAPNVTLSMVEIPGGEFLMGAPKSEEDSSDYERPVSEVKVSPFFMGKFAITQAQWRVVARWPMIGRVLKPEPSYFPRGKRRSPIDDELDGERPVEQVSWEEAREFCARLSQKTGRSYRLPTEAEWEYACRAGTRTPFAIGETVPPEFVNYDGRYPYGKAPNGEYRKETVPVGSLGIANVFGLYDMHGNVWEWCLDFWHNSYQGAPTDGSAWLSGEDSSLRVLRGGSWGSRSINCRSASRGVSRWGDCISDFGFRVVVARIPSGVTQ